MAFKTPWCSMKIFLKKISIVFYQWFLVVLKKIKFFFLKEWIIVLIKKMCLKRLYFRILKRTDHMSFNQFLVFSISAHVLLLILFQLQLKFRSFSTEKIDLRGAIRVDIVDLPDKIVGQKKRFSINKIKKTKKNYKKKQKAALEKLKKLVLSKKKDKKIKAKDKEVSTEDIKTKFKGNRLNSSGALGGLDKIRFDKYYAEIKEYVYAQWKIPSLLDSQGLTARALVVVNSLGAVLSVKIIEFSGNDIFDKSVLQAIERASPFPKVPERLKDLFLKKEIELGFR